MTRPGIERWPMAIKTGPVSFPRFPFHCHLQVFSFAILSLCRLKSPYICFSSYLHQLSADAGCSLQNLQRAKDDIAGRKERVEEIRAVNTT